MMFMYEVLVNGVKLGVCEENERFGLIIAAEQAGVVSPLNGDFSNVEFKLIGTKEEVYVS